MPLNDTKIFKNTFEKGINLDIEEHLTQPGYYRDALNVNITSDGKFFAVKNIKGTVDVASIMSQSLAGTPSVDEGYNVLGAYPVNGYDSSTGALDSGIMYLIAYHSDTTEYRYEIWLFRISTGVSYLMYQDTTLTSAQFDDYKNATSDAVVYSEAGKDYLYLTDGVEKLFKVPCIYEAPAVTQTYTENEISLTRYKNIFSFYDATIGTSGNLPCGSYQVAMRLVNKDFAKYTEWTMLSNPISITEDVTTIPTASIGGNSGKNISIVWSYASSPTYDQVQDFDYIEIAVIPHISGSATPDQNAYLISPLPKADYLSGFQVTYNLTSLDNATSFDINDITIEDAAIKIVKTLAVKNNRLVGGNVEYHQLDYDNTSGAPVINSGSLIYDSPDDTTGYTWSDYENSFKKGYFRDEVYRFAVAYVDKYGNWSKPITLDTSGLTYGVNNVDFKFPGRNTVAGSIWDTVTGYKRSIGVQLTIDQHPTWAVGMAIMRAKRVKNIVAQSPLIPSMLVQPAEALNNYPTIYKESVGGTDVEDLDAQAPNPVGTIMPKNFGHGYAKSIVRDRFDAYANVEDSEVCYTKTYEPQNGSPPFVVYDGSDDHYQLGYIHFVYPPELLYGNGTEKYSALSENYSLNLRTVDATLLYSSWEGLTTKKDASLTDLEDGDFIETYGIIKNVSWSRSLHYYEGTVTTAIPTITASTKIESIDHIGYGDETFLLTSPRKYRQNVDGWKDSVVTSSVMKYSDLEIVNGSDVGITPTPNECFVVVTKDRKPDITHFSYSALSDPFYTNDIDYGPSNAQIAAINFRTHENKFLMGSTPAIVSAVEIVNIENGLSDDRYGNADTFHEFIFTGAYSDISDPNTPATVDVWGGDCYVGQFTFKITDGVYSVTDPEKADSTAYSAQDIIDRWNRYYDNGATTGTDVCRPVPLKGVSQLVSVILESEINPNGIDYNTNIEDSDIWASPTGTSGGDIKTPFNYKHNLSTSVQSDLKIWVNNDALDRSLNETGARIVYSDSKIYNSDIEGFDRFRAASFYDLDESIGDITKLIVSNNRLFAIQEYGYVYIPFDIQVVETADSSSIALSSGTVVGDPIYVSTSYGSQHLRTVKEDRGSIFFFDFKNKVLIKHNDEGMNIISDNGLFSLLNDIDGALATPTQGFTEKSLHAILDKKNRLYILTNRHDETNSVPGFAYVWDDKVGAWTTRLCQSISGETSIWSGVSDIYGRLYLIGKQEGAVNDVKISRMWDGELGTFFGDEQQSYVKFIINPEPEIPKTFDTFVINASNRLDYIYLDVPRPDGTTQKAGVSAGVYGMDIDTADIEGLFKVKTLRDVEVSSGQRMRGTYGIGQIDFKNKAGLDPGTESSLVYVLTRYRPSYRGL